VQRDESGAALILAIAFMLVVGAVAAATVTSVSSGLTDHSSLAQARNREYAADGGIERSIVRVRGLNNPGASALDCPAAGDVYAPIDGVAIRVDCANTPSVSNSPTGPVSQSNVSFAACLITTIPCIPGTSGDLPIITAHVNFQVAGSTVSTFVQAWSVNR
jgi:hypothetical protein